MSIFKVLPVLWAVVALALAGCGGDKPTKAAAPIEKFIFTSAVDCEGGGKISLDDCSKVIQQAIDVHVKTAPTHKSLNTCEELEGTGKCERVAERAYRPSLAAFLITTGEKLAATPLYYTKGDEQALRSLENAMFEGKDDNLTFSKSASDAYERGRR